MYEFNMKITRCESDKWCCFCMPKSEVTALLIKIIELKLGRISGFMLIDPQNKISASLSYRDHSLKLNIENEYYSIATATAEFIVSFLVDQTYPLCDYDHIDFSLENSNGITDIVLSVE